MALVLVALGAYVANWRQTGQALANADRQLVLLSIFFLISTFVIFAIRWSQLIVTDKELPIRELFSFLMIGYLGNAIFPVRPGDILRAVLLNQKYQLGLSTGLASIVIERLIDLSTVCLLGIVMLQLTPLPHVIQSGIYFVSSGVIGLVLLLILIYKNRGFMRCILNSNSGMARFRFVHLLIHSLIRFVTAFEVIKSPRRLVACVMLTALGWALLLAFTMSLLLAFRLNAPPTAALLILIATNLGALLPLSPGAIGVHHFMTVVSLSIWDIDSSTAIAFAIAFHAIAIGLHILLGTVCSWHEGIRYRKLAGLAQRNSPPTSVG